MVVIRKILLQATRIIMEHSDDGQHAFVGCVRQTECPGQKRGCLKNGNGCPKIATACLLITKVKFQAGRAMRR